MPRRPFCAVVSLANQPIVKSVVSVGWKTHDRQPITPMQQVFGPTTNCTGEVRPSPHPAQWKRHIQTHPTTCPSTTGPSCVIERATGRRSRRTSTGILKSCPTCFVLRDSSGLQVSSTTQHRQTGRSVAFNGRPNLNGVASGVIISPRGVE
jgi:hypothetical protein